MMNHLIAAPKEESFELSDLYLIDFELLRRTAKHEKTIRRFRRQRYYQLRLQSRPTVRSDQQREILGIPYIETAVESSGGRLWIRGHESEFSDYFLPEKWQTTPRVKLNRAGNTYLTDSKDGIRLIVKSSKVGMKPLYEDFCVDNDADISYSYNSPFEEAVWAESLQTVGIPTTRLLAIYQMNQESDIAPYLRDERRYENLRDLKDLIGEELLHHKRHYLTIWDYWQGEDEDLLINTVPSFNPMNLLEAYYRELIDTRGYESLLRYVRFKLSAKGFIDYSLKPSHLILAVDRKNKLLNDKTGMPFYRLCSFSLIDSVQK
jgi:hypothetical protein